MQGNIRVFCRVRPLLKEEEKEFGAINHIEFLGNDEKSLIILNVRLCIIIINIWICNEENYRRSKYFALKTDFTRY